ncbi:MAG: alpha/beta fold hydrolase, partial [Candidatus Eisenbacteria bacterium]|nr:alpha/beta fold hydrolase [Candidatus Eisenbacteria bacterium]
VYVLDNLLVNHLALLAETLHERGFPAETLRVVVPQVGAVIDAVVVPKPLEPGAATQADSAAVRDVDLQLGGVTETLRIDARGRLLEMRVPSQGIAYTRVGPGSEIAVTPPGDGARGVPPSGGSTGPGAIPDGTAPNATPLFLEQPVRIPAGGGIELDGVLTFPQGGQPIPYAGIVLVQGSGPLDRDETVGPNRPFLDLARGLAVQGIATLRFDKRTLAAPQTFDPVKGTVKEEVIDDAVAALQFLRYQPEIDGRRIFLLGHSLGGGLAATIAREDRRVAGLVILAGTLRPLDEVLRDQIAYLNRLAAEQGTLSAEQERMQRDLDARLDSLAAGQLRPDARVYGMSAHYLQDYRSRDLEGDFLAFPGPVLILQGGKDYQVTADKDLALWKSVVGASGKKNVTIREFPNLGHLFMPIEGVPSPAAYQVPGHVDPGVIEAISTFVEEARRAGQSRRDR